MQSSTITVTDMFCGAGGSTTGATQAGADVRLAVNHWKRAIETHNTNYPGVEHRLTDLLTARPNTFPTSTILVASPECTSHSLAKGKSRKYEGQPGLWETHAPDPAEERSRCTMYTPLEWAEYHNYQVVILENVVDVQHWRPLPGWLLSWQNLGYDYQWVSLNSMFAHPTPQSRDRAYFVAWKRGNPKPDLAIRPTAYCAKCERDVAAVQCWKQQGKHLGKYHQQYVYCCPEGAREVTPSFYPAASAIDWSRPIQRIGDRAKPLKPKTMERIAYGLEKFKDEPFTVQLNKTTDRVRSVVQGPFPTQTADNGLGLVMSLSHGTRPGYISPVASHPLLTQTTRDDVALIAPPFLIDHVAEYRPRSITQPMSTIVGGGNHQSLVVPPAWIYSYYNNGSLTATAEPVPTVTTLERHALVTATTEQPRVEDCGFRMLEPHEIQAAMAFPASYVVTGTRREKVKQLGNAVTPPVMQLLVGRCIASLS